ncbi:GntR family transcriptional regulator [Pseudomonas sp. ZM23]|uniref:GntR family transcriptional regulator n=1 Tax=Pseudomonas triclosanedens TaxID=2961893 RepID=A0ABY6ZVS2_9PSED|nr:GntR family transcriptional regulator [Pseudomonas triclosanedens]MCP8465379.1 GntR family transcriptional regulator [Pseudomonas triclosanedens]MCP8470681.1 GntR family transcriptional regulator [Pseudomonas triclosanedens]MCP8476678.1 GntR family transcriptional regulator [Pseudomonas triclosanedens]WAI48868.1 GntR family transcriptional regulator [Pseudomonas triclosanedens]
MTEKHPESTVERVYQGVYEAISKRSLRPGMKLGEAALAELFKVSRTSVRAALKQLEADGLVSTALNKGAWVSLPSDEEIRSLFETRRLIEIGIVSELCRRADSAIIQDLRDHVALENAAHDHDHAQFVQLLGEFHIKLAAALNNPVLLDFFRKLIERASLYATTLDDDQHGTCRENEHLRLIEYIEAGNQAAAIELTCMHLNGIEQAILKAAGNLKADYHPLKHLISS